MTIGEKQHAVRSYCDKHTCGEKCAVYAVALNDYNLDVTPRMVCYSADTDELLDKRLAAIGAEEKPAQEEDVVVLPIKGSMPVEDYTRLAEKQDRCQHLCDSITQCENCPCSGLAEHKHDDDCNFELFSEEDLDEYLDHFAAGEETEREFTSAVPDNVNHPKHYELPNGLECIDVLLATQGRDFVMGFCICNAMKYLYRHKRKNGVEDIKKARWYIDKYLELEGKHEDHA